MEGTNYLLDDFIVALNDFGEIKLQESLKKYTTFKTGGPAEILIFPYNRSSLLKIIIQTKREGVPFTVIGGGSNLLVSDRGLSGVVVCLNNNSFREKSIYVNEDGTLYADAVFSKKDFIDFALERSYGGFEFMVGIPGSLGGGIAMNAGTNEGSFDDILDRIDIINSDFLFQTIKNRKGLFSYRGFNLDFNIILGAFFKLERINSSKDLKSKVKEIILDREKKHPLNFPSAGSVFKNPDGYSSWRLIEEAGLKGFRLGGAMISEKHTNFIINYDQATSLDIKNLITEVQDKVMQKFNIFLEPELKILGEF